MRLTFNSSAMKTLKEYQKNILNHSKSINNISTGKKINSSKDDPNNISRVDSLDKEIRGYQGARKNIQDAVSMLQSADSVLQTVNDRISRVRELVISCENGAMDDNEKDIIQDEICGLLNGIDYDVQEFSFNKVNILGGGTKADNINASIGFLSTGNPGEISEIPKFDLVTEKLGIHNIKVSDDIDINLEKIDNAISIILDARANIGSLSSTLSDKVDQLSSIEEVITGAKSRIEDSDIALEMIDFTKSLILSDSEIKNMNKSIYLPSDVVNVLGRLYKY